MQIMFFSLWVHFISFYKGFKDNVRYSSEKKMVFIPTILSF